MANQTLAVDFNKIRIAFARCMQGVLPKLPDVTQPMTVALAEPETQNTPQPKLPYFTFKFTTPGAKSGDDTKSWVLDNMGNPTTIVNSGGVRKMTIDFDSYAQSHEDAYNFMAIWQTALDLEDIQAILRQTGIAVWIIGNVADLSALLNTGYEGRAHMTCTFGIAMNLQSDLGEMDHVQVSGTVKESPGGSEIAVPQGTYP
jgi:hypothetical protein